MRAFTTAVGQDWFEKMHQGSIDLGLNHVITFPGEVYQARTWCTVQLGHPWPMTLEQITDAHLWAAWGIKFYFRREQDALLFKLRWVG